MEFNLLPKLKSGMSYERWFDRYKEDLGRIYDKVREYLLKEPLFDLGDNLFEDFCHFIYESSSKT